MRCAKYKSEKFNGSLTTTNNYKILKEQMHSPHCTPDFAANKIAIKLDACKKQVSSTTVPVSAIFNNTLAEIKASGINSGTEVPSFKSIKSSLYRARKKSGI